MVQFPVHYLLLVPMVRLTPNYFRTGFFIIFSCMHPPPPPVRPLLLLMDGHSSHYSPTFVNKAAEEKVIFFCLPPNSTHRTQPLDKGAFSPLKMMWREECHNFLSKNPGKVITHYHFGAIFSNAWKRAMTSTNIMAGFKLSGVYPLNRYALIPQNPQQQSLCERTGLNYIPFYTPKKSRQIRVPQISQARNQLEQSHSLLDTTLNDTSQYDTYQYNQYGSQFDDSQFDDSRFDDSRFDDSI